MCAVHGLHASRHAVRFCSNRRCMTLQEMTCTLKRFERHAWNSKLLLLPFAVAFHLIRIIKNELFNLTHPFILKS